MKNWIPGGIFLVLASLSLAAEDLPFDAAAAWKIQEYPGDGVSVTSVVEKSGDREVPALRIAAPPAGKKAPFCGLRVDFDSARDWRDVGGLRIAARSDRPLKLMVTIYCDGGQLIGKYRRESLSPRAGIYCFDMAEMQKNGNPDPGKVWAVAIGLGTWEYDAAARGFELFLWEPPPEEKADFLVPRPTAPVGIDAAYQDDWGEENNYYVWTPPEFFELKASDPETCLDGRFSFMFDDEFFYFLAIVSDDTRQTTDNGAPYRNDGVELFLAPATGRRIQEGAEFSGRGIQLVFDCGPGEGKAYFFPGGSAPAAPFSAAFRREMRPDATGGMVSGYVLECAIPWSMFGAFPGRGKRIAYCVKLNDGDSGRSLSLVPENPSLHRTIAHYKSAFLENIAPETAVVHTFGPVAADLPWPQQYHAGSVPAWSEAFLERRTVSCSAERLYLNGLWAVQSVRKEEDSPDPANWFRQPVPLGIGRHTPLFRPESDGDRELEFERMFPDGASFLWYERTALIPAEWRECKVRFQTEFIRREGELFINGEWAGHLKNGTPALDVTAQLHFGEINRFDIRAFTERRDRMGPENGVIGISGDIWLEASATEPVIRKFRIVEASGLDGSFELDVETVPGFDGKLYGEILDGDRVVCSGLVGKFAGFEPWSPESPRLYTFRLSARTREGTLLEERTRLFGFRTFETTPDGKFLLNGKIIRLRCGFLKQNAGFYEPFRLETMRRFGFNAIYLPALSDGWMEPIYSLLDKHGFLALAPIDRAASREAAAAAVETASHHPSVIGYISDSFGQLDVNGFIHNPFATDDAVLPDSPVARKIMEHLKQRETFFHSLDPTRRYVPQGTGNFPGFMRNTHQYHTNDLNLTDRYRYQEPWAKRSNPSLPLWIYEAGTFNLPWFDAAHPDYRMPPPENYPGGPVQRQLFFEVANRYYGDEAFVRHNELNALFFKTSVRNFRLNQVDGFCCWGIGEDLFLRGHRLPAEDRRRLEPKYFTRPYRENIEAAAMRVTSEHYCWCIANGAVLWPWPEEYGLAPVEEKPSIFTEFFQNEMQPVFAAVTGTQEDVFRLDHNYFGGETLKRVVSVRNDSARAVDWEGCVKLRLDDRIVAAETLHAHVEQGGRVELPFEFHLPETHEKLSGALELGNDRFAITVFPNLSSHGAFTTATIGIIGSPGILAEMGCRLVAVNPAEGIPDDVRNLAVGTGAFAESIAPMLEEFVRQGGNLLILPQRAASVPDGTLQERWEERLFFSDHDHPIAAGLDDVDLSFWRGSAATLPDHKAPASVYRNGQSAALATPHLSNAGIVAGSLWGKPQLGRFRPLVNAGYNLGDSAILECFSGRGRVLFCQAELEGRYRLDPAATLLAENLLNYFLSSFEAPRAGVRVFGELSSEWRERLRLKLDPAGRVAVIAAGGKVTGEELDGVETILVLPEAEYLPSELRELKIRTTPDFVFRAGNYYQFNNETAVWGGPDFFDDGNGRFFRHLQAADLYFWERPAVKSFQIPAGATDVVRSRFGTLLSYRDEAGRDVVLCGVPAAPELSGESRGKLARIWSIILTNAGVADGGEFSLRPSEWDLSRREWRFSPDPDGVNSPELIPAESIPIRTGSSWEEQGITVRNRNLPAVPDSDYDGAGWYYCDAELPPVPESKSIYLHLGAVSDIFTFDRRAHRTELWINGVKVENCKAWNAHSGGRGGRLFSVPPGVLKRGKNRIAIRIYNEIGPGGIIRNPVRFEFSGVNPGMLGGFEFQESKYTNYFFWCW